MTGRMKDASSANRPTYEQQRYIKV